MIPSRPLLSALSFYFDQLFNHPIRTKSISCCIVATAGNFTSQYINNRAEVIENKDLLAYGLFGLLFGGTVPHYFQLWLENLVPDDTAFSITKKLLVERLIYSPLYQALTLYTIARFEGKNHTTALAQLKDLYWIILHASWKFLTIVQLLNYNFVPPMLRIFINLLITFFWTIYIANKRRELKNGKH